MFNYKYLDTEIWPLLACLKQLQFGFGGLGYDDTEEAAVNFARHIGVSD